jgi:coenzyme Q-binding protein COQ10
MHHFEHTKFVNYTAKQMFDLVLDIESYPDFLPWCSEAKIVQKITKDHAIADLTIGFKAFVQKYRSNVLARRQGEIYFVDVESVKGVFKTLKCSWVFIPCDSGVNVKFEIDLALKSSLLQGLIVLLFDEISRKIISRFESRAKKIYPNFG